LRHLIWEAGDVGDFQVGGANGVDGATDNPESSVAGGGQIAYQPAGRGIDQVVDRDRAGGKAQLRADRGAEPFDVQKVASLIGRVDPRL